MFMTSNSSPECADAFPCEGTSADLSTKSCPNPTLLFHPLDSLAEEQQHPLPHFYGVAQTGHHLSFVVPNSYRSLGFDES